MAHKKEIVWNLVNAGLAGALILLGALSTGEISLKSFGLALVASLAVAVNKFYDYWKNEEREYSSKLFKFL